MSVPCVHFYLRVRVDGAFSALISAHYTQQEMLDYAVLDRGLTSSQENMNLLHGFCAQVRVQEILFSTL